MLTSSFAGSLQVSFLTASVSDATAMCAVQPERSGAGQSRRETQSVAALGSFTATLAVSRSTEPLLVFYGRDTGHVDVGWMRLSALDQPFFSAMAHESVLLPFASKRAARVGVLVPSPPHINRVACLLGDADVVFIEAVPEGDGAPRRVGSAISLPFGLKFSAAFRAHAWLATRGTLLVGTTTGSVVEVDPRTARTRVVLSEDAPVHQVDVVASMARAADTAAEKPAWDGDAGGVCFVTVSTAKRTLIAVDDCRAGVASAPLEQRWGDGGDSVPNVVGSKQRAEGLFGGCCVAPPVMPLRDAPAIEEDVTAAEEEQGPQFFVARPKCRMFAGDPATGAVAQTIKLPAHGFELGALTSLFGRLNAAATDDGGGDAAEGDQPPSAALLLHEGPSHVAIVNTQQAEWHATIAVPCEHDDRPVEAMTAAFLAFGCFYVGLCDTGAVFAAPVAPIPKVTVAAVAKRVTVALCPTDVVEGASDAGCSTATNDDSDGEESPTDHTDDDVDGGDDDDEAQLGDDGVYPVTPDALSTPDAVTPDAVPINPAVTPAPLRVSLTEDALRAAGRPAAPGPQPTQSPQKALPSPFTPAAGASRAVPAFELLPPDDALYFQRLEDEMVRLYLRCGAKLGAAAAAAAAAAARDGDEPSAKAVSVEGLPHADGVDLLLAMKPFLWALTPAIRAAEGERVKSRARRRPASGLFWNSETVVRIVYILRCALAICVRHDTEQALPGAEGDDAAPIALNDPDAAAVDGGVLRGLPTAVHSAVIPSMSRDGTTALNTLTAVSKEELPVSHYDRLAAVIVATLKALSAQDEGNVEAICRDIFLWHRVSRSDGFVSDAALMHYRQRLGVDAAGTVIDGLFPLLDSAQVNTWVHRRQRLTILENHIVNGDAACVSLIRESACCLAHSVFYLPFLGATLPSKAQQIAVALFPVVPVSFMVWAMSAYVQLQAHNIIGQCRQRPAQGICPEETQDFLCDYVVLLLQLEGERSVYRGAVGTFSCLRVLLERRQAVMRRFVETNGEQFPDERRRAAARQEAAESGKKLKYLDIWIDDITAAGGGRRHLRQHRTETQKLFTEYEYHRGIFGLQLVDQCVDDAVIAGRLDSLLPLFGTLDGPCDRDWVYLFMTARDHKLLDMSFVLCLSCLHRPTQVNFLIRSAFPFIDDATTASDPQLCVVRNKLSVLLRGS
jgi:hypothetical protein